MFSYIIFISVLMCYSQLYYTKMEVKAPSRDFEFNPPTPNQPSPTPPTHNPPHT